MKICVCLKVVPDRNKIIFDPEQGSIRRTKEGSTINPSDLVAFEAAFQLSKLYNGKVDALCMGPESIASVLRTMFSMGADNIHLLSSPAFRGADVAATAYTLSCFFKTFEEKYDIIMCGNSSYDGNTGFVGAYLSEKLNLPHVTSVFKINGIHNSELDVVQRLDDLIQFIKIKMPCLLTISQDTVHPHTPTLGDTLRARKRQVKIWNEYSLSELDPSRCGIKGSMTQVKNITIPKKNLKLSMICENDLNVILPLITSNLT
ncbi:MAG: electron transfer flavoprotein subunit beta/FixA family protein [Zhaonellaceae bacterium]|jgi:electron transfer flavoprotein alpha/beta subunit